MSRSLALAVAIALFSCDPCAAQQGGFGAPLRPGPERRLLWVP